MAAELFNRPRITGKTPEEKIDQLTTYIYQLVEQLNWAFNALPGATDISDSGDTAGR